MPTTNYVKAFWRSPDGKPMHDFETFDDDRGGEALQAVERLRQRVRRYRERLPGYHNAASPQISVWRKTSEIPRTPQIGLFVGYVQ